MNGLFWLLLIPAVGTFGLIAWTTDRLCRSGLQVYRRWAVRREIRSRRADTFIVIDGIAVRSDLRDYEQRQLVEMMNRRAELDGLATSQDKAARRIVH